jgi:type VI secretion system protein ImpC
MSTGEEQKLEEQVAPEAESAAPSLLESAIAATKHTERSRAEELLRTLTTEALKGTVTVDKDVVRSITAGIRKLDEAISTQLSAIMHQPQFQQLEGSWRGLWHLVYNSETSARLKLKVFNCGKRELFKDLDRAVEFDQSEIFKKIYSSEFDMAGGEPYGALLGDYEFSNHPDDVSLLNKISNVAASGFCPFISSASASLFGFDGWTELTKPRDLEKIFDTVEYTQWKSFRDSEDSRFVVLTMPRTLARLPYGKNTKPVDEFEFEEVELGQDGKPIGVPHDQYCWMSTAYVLGARLTDAFAKYGFCTAIRGANSGGRVEDLPAHIFRTTDGDMDLKCPTEIAIGDRREAELSKLGFLPLVHYKNTDYAVFFGGQTTQKAKVYDRDEATENAQISARLPYIMATSRFAHYLKAIGRDWIGSFKETDDLNRELNRWIANYVTADSNASEDERAKFPLREAKVQVVPIPGQSGAYNAVAWLRPWLQMEELNASLRMVAKIPAQQGG